MSDGRSEDSRLPHRTLAGPGKSDARAPLSERVSAAIASAGQAVQSTPAAPATPTRETRVPPVRQPSKPAPPSQPPVAQRQDDAPSPAPAPLPRPSSGRVRKARLRLTHLDPWSVMKTAFLLSVAVGIVTVVAVAVIWAVLGVAGVWDSINNTVSDFQGPGSQPFDVRDYVGASRVMGFTMIVAVVDVILITALATLGAFLYNLSAALLGGLEVTLAEDEH